MADVPEQVLGEGEGLANESTDSLAQCEVEALDMIGLSLGFAARLVLVFWENLPIRAVEVAVAHLGFVAHWHLVPQRLARQLVALPRVPGHHLARSSTQRDPDPHLVLFVANKRPQLIQFQNILLLRWGKSRFQIRRLARALFLKQKLVFF